MSATREARRAAIPIAATYWERAVTELTAIYAWVAARPAETAAPADLADIGTRSGGGSAERGRSISTPSGARTR